MSNPALAKNIVTPSPPQKSIILSTFTKLACDDDIPLETEQHKLQMELLIDSLRLWLDKFPNGYVGGNMFVHYLTSDGRIQGTGCSSGIGCTKRDS